MTTPVLKDALGLNAVKWLDPLNITWSLATANIPQQTNLQKPNPYSGFIDTPEEKAIFETAFKAAIESWETIGNVKFVQVADGPSVDIRVGFGNFDTNFIGWTWYEWDNLDHFRPGTVLQTQDPAQRAVISTPAGYEYSGFSTTVAQNFRHEIGHALGLLHSPDDPNSVMYFGLGTLNRIPDAGDHLAIQFLYPTHVTPMPVTNPSPTMLMPTSNPAIGLSDFAGLSVTPADFLVPSASLPDEQGKTIRMTGWDPSTHMTAAPDVYWHDNAYGCSISYPSRSA
jgi:hypothetical protein